MSEDTGTVGRSAWHLIATQQVLVVSVLRIIVISTYLNLPNVFLAEMFLFFRNVFFAKMPCMFAK